MSSARCWAASAADAPPPPRTLTVGGRDTTAAASREGAEAGAAGPGAGAGGAGGGARGSENTSPGVRGGRGGGGGWGGWGVGRGSGVGSGRNRPRAAPVAVRGRCLGCCVPPPHPPSNHLPASPTSRLAGCQVHTVLLGQGAQLGRAQGGNGCPPAHRVNCRHRSGWQGDDVRHTGRHGGQQGQAHAQHVGWRAKRGRAPRECARHASRTPSNHPLTLSPLNAPAQKRRRARRAGRPPRKSRPQWEGRPPPRRPGPGPG